MSNEDFDIRENIRFEKQILLEEKLRKLESNEDKRTIIFNYLDDILKNKIKILDFGSDLNWINVSRPLSLHNDLNGLVVILDFFTYCCINCMHILPNLFHIEKCYKDSLVVIGVHSPKFINEKDLTNVADAVLRYNIKHPVANDPNGIIWSTLNIQCWPTLLILGPDSELLITLIGETGVDEFLGLYSQVITDYFKLKNTIDYDQSSRLPMRLLSESTPDGFLSFPGKVSPSCDQTMLAISDTKHNRIIISTINGIVLYVIGTGEEGFRDGGFDEARFNNPEGVGWRDNHIVYVCDTDNHSVRQIDLVERSVVTLAGTGTQSHDTTGGRHGTQQGLSSPWDLVYLPTGVLLIANSGTHQIWALILAGQTEILNNTYSHNSCVALSGTGREENRNNTYYDKASYAQPSGLSFDQSHNILYVADSESSSIRSLNLNTGAVTGIVGGDKNPLNLFSFGDVDGKGTLAKLQHPLGVAINNQSLFIADTYNHKIKQVDLTSNECISIAGTGQKGNRTNCKMLECEFNEPGGLCLVNHEHIFVADTNNHSIKKIDLSNNYISELKLLNSLIGPDNI